jgi:hypothetical protein
MAALIASWIYGAQALSDGYEALSFFRGERPDIHVATDPIATAEARDAAYAAGEHWLQVKEAASRREMPFGAVSLLLGGAMVLFAARSMAGREGSRSALVQVLVVHAGARVAAFLLTRDVGLAEVAFQTRISDAAAAAMAHSFKDPADVQRYLGMMHALPLVLAPLALIMHTAFSALVVLALTRPRARAFFHEAASGPLGEG